MDNRDDRMKVYSSTPTPYNLYKLYTVDLKKPEKLLLPFFNSGLIEKARIVNRSGQQSIDLEQKTSLSKIFLALSRNSIDSQLNLRLFGRSGLLDELEIDLDLGQSLKRIIGRETGSFLSSKSNSISYKMMIPWSFTSLKLAMTESGSNFMENNRVYCKFEDNQNGYFLKFTQEILQKQEKRAKMNFLTIGRKLGLRNNDFLSFSFTHMILAEDWKFMFFSNFSKIMKIYNFPLFVDCRLSIGSLSFGKEFPSRLIGKGIKTDMSFLLRPYHQRKTSPFLFVHIEKNNKSVGIKECEIGVNFKSKKDKSQLSIVLF